MPTRLTTNSAPGSSTTPVRSLSMRPALLRRPCSLQRKSRQPVRSTGSAPQLRSSANELESEAASPLASSLMSTVPTLAALGTAGPAGAAAAGIAGTRSPATRARIETARMQEPGHAARVSRRGERLTSSVPVSGERSARFRKRASPADRGGPQPPVFAGLARNRQWVSAWRCPPCSRRPAASRRTARAAPCRWPRSGAGHPSRAARGTRARRHPGRR